MKTSEEIVELIAFFEFIKHGDECHIAWLKKAFNEFWGIEIP